MRFDELYQEIGEFGPYQILVVNLGCSTSLYAGITFLTSFFTLAIPEHRCAIPGLVNDTYAVQSDLHLDLINQTIPLSDDPDHVYDQCHVFTWTEDGHVTTEKCDRWVYDTSIFTSTLGAELNMVCDRAILKSNAQMSFFGGLIVGSFVTGLASDRFGRKITLCVSSIFYFLAALATAWSTSFAYLFAMTFLVGFFSVGNFMSSFVNGMEFVGPSMRRFAGTLGGFYWTSGTLLLALLGYLIRDWKTLQIVAAMPGILFQLFWIIYPESPRWLYVRGRHAEAKAILHKIAKINKRQLTDKMYESLETEAEHKPGQETQKDKVWHLFTSRRLCIRTLVLFFNWLAVCMAYYGMALNSADLGGDLFVDFTLQAAMDIPAKIIVVSLLNRTGRKFLMVSSLITGGVGFIATIFITMFASSELAWLNTTMALLGKFGAAAAYPVVYVFSAELFPTVVRNAGMGACSCVSRVGGMIAPYVADMDRLIDGKIGKTMPMIVFGAFSMVGGLISFYLPETLNKPLPETIEDGERFGMTEATDLHATDKAEKDKKNVGENIDMNISAIENNGYLYSVKM